MRHITNNDFIHSNIPISIQLMLNLFYVAEKIYYICVVGIELFLSRMEIFE